MAFDLTLAVVYQSQTVIMSLRGHSSNHVLGTKHWACTCWDTSPLAYQGLGWRVRTLGGANYAEPQRETYKGPAVPSTYTLNTVPRPSHRNPNLMTLVILSALRRRSTTPQSAAEFPDARPLLAHHGTPGARHNTRRRLDRSIRQEPPRQRERRALDPVSPLRTALRTGGAQPRRRRIP